MDYTTFGTTGLQVSRIALGTGNFGTGWGHGADPDTSKAIFNAYAEAGGNFIDTADVYQFGQSEEILGGLLQGRREEFVLATKFTRGDAPNAGRLVTGNSRKAMAACVDASLKRLQTDRIDIYWVHWPDNVTPAEEIVRGFEDLARAGKILYAGLSNFPAWRLARAVTLAELTRAVPIAAAQFAAFAPLAHFGRRFGMERTLVAALLLLFVGVLLRSWGSIPALFAGTLLLAAGIAVGNILVPGIVKRDYPERVKPLMTIYAVTLGLSAAIASGLAVPFAAWLPGGWQGALAIWAVPALVAALAWTPIALRNGKPISNSGMAATTPVWRSPLAWFVTGFMGLQSLYFYVAIAWLPSIFQRNGHDPAEAGLLITVFQLVALAISAMLPLLLGRRKDQSFAAAIASLAMAVSVAGLLIFPAGAYFWMVLMGLGGGACLPLALMFISLRSADHHQTASLSMMAQSIGYLLAALGPFAFGFIHDLSGSWTIPLGGLAVLGVILALVGCEAGRDKTISSS